MRDLMDSSDMAVMGDLMDSSELTKRACFDDPKHAFVCDQFRSKCNSKGNFFSTANYNTFTKEWCKKTCGRC